MNPKNPIYIISKGRWEKRKTSRMLEEINVPYKIVVEPSEYDNYAEVIDEAKILKLPSNFSELGQASIPVRNWVWEHSLKNGDDWHWLLDDNIRCLYRYNHNMRVKCYSGTPFRIIEEFVNRYTNIAQAGMQYDYFAPQDKTRAPMVFNTRIYSCILMRNSLPHRWRGRYNEDTDLSLRILKDGWCTVLFYALLVGKTPTLQDKGGNTDSIYNKGDKRYLFAKSLADQHPDVAKVVWKFNRWHHQVDYSSFRHTLLIRKPGLKIPREVNNFKLVRFDIAR